jgi:uncharacterized protein
MHRRKINGEVDPRPWCQVFYGAMRLRLPAWAPLLDASNVNHGQLLPILLHCLDDQEQPLLGPPQSGGETRRAYADIPLTVEAIRRYWTPISYARACHYANDDAIAVGARGRQAPLSLSPRNQMIKELP